MDIRVGDEVVLVDGGPVVYRVDAVAADSFSLTKLGGQGETPGPTVSRAMIRFVVRRGDQ